MTGLAGPCVSRCFTGQRGAFPPGRLATFPVPEVVELVGERDVDVGAALGEHAEQLVGHAGDLGLAVDDRPPLDAEPVGELGAEDGLVEAAEHPLVPLQVAGVERVPAAVGCLDLGGDDGVGVDLRVVGSRRGLTERRHREPVRVRVQAAAVGSDAGRRPEPLEVRQRRSDGDVVRFEQPVVAGQRPPHRQ